VPHYDATFGLGSPATRSIFFGEAMVLARRRFLRLAGGIAALPALANGATAQSYPKRPVKLIVGLPAGGAPDIYARLLADWLSKRSGQAFVVEDRPGASGNIATEAVIRAAPDGYTLLVVIAPNVINPTLYPHLKFNFIHETTPVASIGGSPFVMVVNPSVPARTVPQFIAHAKANPGKINIAVTDLGSVTRMAAELFKMMAGVDLVIVPHVGETAALTDLLSNQVQVMFDPIPSALGYVHNGQLRALAVTSTKPVDSFPDVPPVAQFLPGYEALGVTGIVAPRGTPDDIVTTLNKAINTALADPKMKQRFAALGTATRISSPAEFGEIIVSETAKWAKVIKFAKIKTE
jgi:tripartite-type tricarboxylate transporter receptor subunit TctC